MTPYQQAIIRVVQTIFITLLITGLALTIFMPKRVATVELMECSYVAYPVRWHCVTQTVTLDALNKHNEEAQRQRPDRQ